MKNTIMKTIQTMKNHAKKTLQIAALSAAMLFSVNGFADSIHQAAFRGDTAEVKRMIKAGADVNADNGSGYTPLHGAAHYDQTETALALIKAGADVHAQNKNGYTPLHSAAQYGKTELVLALIKAGVEIEARDEYGNTPLHLAAWQGKTEIVLALIQAGADVNDRALRYAVQDGHSALIKLFLKPEYKLTQEDIDITLIETEDSDDATTQKGVKLLKYHLKNRQ